MRKQIGRVVEGARDGMLRWHEAMQSQGGLTDEEAAIRYATQHRNRPGAILAFVRQNAPEGRDPTEAAIEYEREMENLLRQQQRRQDANRSL